MLDLVVDIRKRYRWGLLAIAILISVSVSLMQYLLYIQKGDAQVINLAGKQRMLSQKIALYGNALIFEQSEQTHQHRMLLQHAVEQFVAGHQFLLQKDSSGQFLYLNDALKAHYFSSPTQLDLHVKQYISKAQQLLNSRSNYGTQGRSPFSSEHLEKLLMDLDEAVYLLEQSAVTKVKVISILEIVFWIIAIGLLIVELIFIFKPMEKLIAKTIKQYQQQKEVVERVSHNKERFIARASHEFRTPLQGLTASIEALDINDTQQLTKKQALYCVNRLVSMLDELLDLQKLTTGEWQLNLAQGNLLTSLKQAVTPFEYACNDKKITFTINFAESVNKQVISDHGRLQQVFAELVNNAVKFTPPQGRIAVTASCQGEKGFVFEVQDNGKGFDHSSSDFLNDEQDAEQHFQGLKTGLFRVKQIIKALEGDIQFFNVQPHGVKVVVKLAFKQAPKEVAKALLPSNLHCLIVEDNTLNATILGRILSQFNYTYDIAPNGLIATDMTETKPYDVIFMDLNMPVMDGFQAIDIIRNEQCQLTPILAVTANTSSEDLQRIYALGANLHLYKPITAETVEKALTIMFAENRAE
jgi:signal transduction histidine kinase/CheY-like chemotaxis protein